MIKDIIKNSEEKMKKTISVLNSELSTMKAGRANPTMLDRIQVEYYGSLCPLNQVANVSAPEPRVLMITPWEKPLLKDIERAILKSDLGLNPSNDGSVIRLIIPELTEETRKNLVKNVKKPLLKDIERAILKSDLGLNPSNDGSVIRLIIPELTEETRKNLVKNVKKTGEDAKVAVRSVRRDANEKIKALKKDSDISEDEIKKGEDQVQKITDSYVKEIDNIISAKEKEIMSI